MSVLALLLLVPAPPQDVPPEQKAAIKKVQWLVGTWRVIVQAGRESWIERQTWGFRFGEGEWALRVDVKDGKLFGSGVLRFDPKAKRYRLERSLPDGGRAVFEGGLKDRELVLDEVVAEGKPQRRVTWMFLRDNRFIGTVGRRRPGRKTFVETHDYQFTKEGVPFARRSGPKCVVTGGTGTTEVAYGGRKYLVCCSGCRDEFRRNPEKILAAARKEGYIK